jgi:hypothetical protein
MTLRGGHTWRVGTQAAMSVPESVRHIHCEPRSDCGGGVMKELQRISFLVLTVLMAATASVRGETTAESSGTTPPLYTVKDGNKVDAMTLAGWKTWRSLACDRCHGAAQEGSVGPSLLVSLKTRTKEEFRAALLNGRVEKGMPAYSSSKLATENWEGLYAYLKGRSDGRIQAGRLSALDSD